MLFIRISAVIAALYALLNITAFFIPLFYNLPLRFHFEAGDVISAITNISLLVGAFFAIRYADTSALIAAWSWSLALLASALVHEITDPHNFTLAILQSKDAETQANMRKLFEQAHQAELHILMAHLAVPLVALVLVLMGPQSARRIS
ncbi:MAG TPA: hypothetical protein VGH02_15310 [Rhizomicrobium sp.]|jgi:hypothetical protein